MAVPSKDFNAPEDNEIDVDSPGNETLWTKIRDALINLEERMGKNYTGAVDHDHNGINSKAITIPNQSILDNHIALDNITNALIAPNAVGQSELKDALQQSTGSAAANIIFTGGAFTLGWGAAGADYDVNAYSAGGYTWGIRLIKTTGDYFFQARYFTASAPYNLGNGDIPIFVFVVINGAGEIIATDTAEAPPWFYNGRPENTFNPKKYKRKKGKSNYFYDQLVMPDKAVNFEAYLDALENPQDYIEEIEITPAMKNLDMDIIPHPFIGNDLAGKSVVLLDPVGSMAEKMRDLHDMGESVADLLMDGYLLIDNEDAGAISPVGVTTHKVKWK